MSARQQILYEPASRPSRIVAKIHGLREKREKYLLGYHPFSTIAYESDIDVDVADRTMEYAKALLKSVVFFERKDDRGVLEARFRDLAAKWEDETVFDSSMANAAMNENYQQIIGMGPAAIPFILKELRENGGHWFWALRMITREDPVPPESRGHIQDMRQKWLDWGVRNNYL